MSGAFPHDISKSESGYWVVNSLPKAGAEFESYDLAMTERAKRNLRWVIETGIADTDMPVDSKSMNQFGTHRQYYEAIIATATQ